MIGASPPSPSSKFDALHDVDFIERGVADFLAQDVDCFLGAAVILDESLANFLRRRADQLDLAFQQEAEAVDAVDVERITGRDDKALSVARDRDHSKTARLLRPDLIDHVLRDNDVGEINPTHLGLGGEAAGNIVGRYQSLPDENVDHAFLAVEIGAGFVDLPTGHQPGIAQKIENAVLR